MLLHLQSKGEVRAAGLVPTSSSTRPQRTDSDCTIPDPASKDQRRQGVPASSDLPLGFASFSFC